MASSLAAAAAAFASLSSLTISSKLPLISSSSTSASLPSKFNLRRPGPSSLSFPSHRLHLPHKKSSASVIASSSDSEALLLEAEPETTDVVVSPVDETVTAVAKREEIFAVVMVRLESHFTNHEEDLLIREMIDLIIVQIGSRQYIVFPGRFLYTQRLKGANVNDKIILNKVLLVGTKTSTWIGKPIVQNAVVHAVVEEQGLNAKVIVFKYKRKKNYRRNIGHRQPNTRIRIMGITGYENSPFVTLES